MNTAPITLFVVVKHTKSLGASEDLVIAAAERLAAEGQSCAFWFNFRPQESDQRIQRLRAVNYPIYYPNRTGLSVRIRRRFQSSALQHTVKRSLTSALRLERPQLVVLNQGGNSDASIEAAHLLQLAAPYVVLCHAATESTWPSPEFLPRMRTIFTGAAHCFFVSKWVQELTEAQLGMVLDHASVVYNPCKFSQVQSSGWPSSGEARSLAVVSRLENKQKGHDLILRTLAQPHWRQRNLTVTFYGEGPHRETLESYAKALGLDSVIFAGHISDIASIWDNHHAFIQASRYEGYGLSLLEAMFCQRMVISTPIPSATEFVTEGETGFLARAASVAELDDALERAWASKETWQDMGLAAARRVEQRYPQDPVHNFLLRLEDCRNK